MIRPATIAAVMILAAAPASAEPAANQANGPSFPCAAAATAVEKAICSDRTLSRLDLSLDSVFRRALAARPEGRAATLDGQRRWLKDRGRLCPGPGDAGQAACLIDLYAARIAELTRTAPPADPLVPGIAAKPVQTLRIGPDGQVIAR